MAEGSLQLTVRSRGDADCPFSAQLSVALLRYSGGTLRGLSAIAQRLPVPIGAGIDAPTWLLAYGPATAIRDASLTIEISAPDGATESITVTGANVAMWSARNTVEPTHQIYLGGDCGIIGYAQPHRARLVYVITAGVFRPRTRAGTQR